MWRHLLLFALNLEGLLLESVYEKLNEKGVSAL